MSFELLSEPIRKFIRDQGWEHLRPIQNAAIAKILSSNENFILASKTASGKTEAAFLPILSKVDFNNSGVQVLYISPLIALINDQFYRVEALCKNLEVRVTKWHGEANKTLKNKLIQNPSGIVLITPESLEAMFVNNPYYVTQLFSNLKFVVIDEIHSFIGTERGIQLKSLLSRLQNINNQSYSIIGLSATIGDYKEAKKFTGNEINTKVLLDRTGKEINIRFRFFKNDGTGLSLELLKDLYIETKDNKVLIFPNNRGKVEEVAVKLKKISEKVKGHSNYFSHHSSIDRDVREFIEYFAKNNKNNSFCISCTSTLELGIDIGSVDEVVQIDATHSIASLIQRVGRSGRNDGQISNLLIYSTDEWSLLQSVACWLLYKENFIEPPEKIDKPYDVLVHQALSITKSNSGILFLDLIKQLKNNFAFQLIEQTEIEEIIIHLIEIDFLEKIQNEVIIGVEGEKIVNSREFYSVFLTEKNLKIIHSGNTIGEIPFSPQISINNNIFLSAKIWKITFIDFIAKKIEVITANDGKPPIFFGDGVDVHHKIREKMFEILYSKTTYDFLNESCIDEIEILRKDFSFYNIQDFYFERPLLLSDKKIKLFSFTSTKINRTIKFLFDIKEIKYSFDESKSCFEIYSSKEELLNIWNHLIDFLKDIDCHIFRLLETNPDFVTFSKWGKFLSKTYQVKLLKNKYFDFQQTEGFITNIRFISNYQ